MSYRAISHKVGLFAGASAAISCYMMVFDDLKAKNRAGEGPELIASTRCEPVGTSSYPNFSRHGKNAPLPKYLTPAVYETLKDAKTSFGVTLEDIMQAGVTLPFGANPPRGLAGIYVGDAESYRVFAPLLDPIIFNHHKAYHRRRLRRHQTNLNPKQLLQKELDPSGHYILYTRMRLARSVDGFPFAPKISRAARRAIEQLFMECTSDWNEGGAYVRIMDMSNAQHEDLVRKKILFPDPDSFAIAAGLGRDWPDARGIYCDTWDDIPNVMIWCNAQDHLWILSNARGGDVQTVFTRLSKAAWALETSLKLRGHSFIEDRRLGFLNTSPANIGTGLRASVYMKLVRLGQHPNFDQLVRNLRLEVRSDLSTMDERYSGIFDIGNAEALGKSEVDLINIMIRGVGHLIELEKRLENGEELTEEDFGI